MQRAVPDDDLPVRATLRRWAQAALERDARVTLRFVAAREGRALNRDFRGRDYATNVLTFVYDSGVPVEGDIVVCAAGRASRSASAAQAGSRPSRPSRRPRHAAPARLRSPT